MFVGASSECVQVGSQILHLKELLVSRQLGGAFRRRRRGFTP